MTKPLTEEELRTETGDVIVRMLREEIWQIDGTPTATVKQLDGQFRKRAMVPGSEFGLVDVYFGARKDMIFQFEPVGAKEFTLEASWRDVDKLFPDFGAILGERAKIESEDTKFVVSSMIKAAARDETLRIEEQTKEDAKRAASTYQNNPNFGRF